MAALSLLSFVYAVFFEVLPFNLAKSHSTALSGYNTSGRMEKEVSENSYNCAMGRRQKMGLKQQLKVPIDPRMYDNPWLLIADLAQQA